MTNSSGLSTRSCAVHPFPSTFFERFLSCQMLIQHYWSHENSGQFSMDPASTLIINGTTDDFPSINVSDSATVDGTLVIRISPSATANFGVWQNYTIMTCRQQCHGSFQSVVIELESVSSCSSIDKFQQLNEGHAHRILFLIKHLDACVATVYLPPLFYCMITLVLLLMML